MTLREYLQKMGLKSDYSQQARLGEVLSDRFLEKFGIRPTKVSFPEENLSLNSYQEDFLTLNDPFIKSFLSPKRKRVKKVILAASVKPSNK